jgi:hypothetical protein
VPPPRAVSGLQCTRPEPYSGGSTAPALASGSVKARAGLFSRNTSPSQPSTDAFLSRRRWTERVGRADDARLREPFRSRAAEHQNSLLESSWFPEDPFRQAAHHRYRFPESKAPSADGSLLASALLAPCFRKFLSPWVLEYRVPAMRGSPARVAHF